MQNLWRVLTIFICFIAISCGKSPVALDDELKSSYDAQTTSPSCESTDLYTNVLDQGNVQNLFQCIGWDKEFPSIYTFINDFSPEEFAYISEPLNELFFKDIATRNGFIDFVIQNVDSETIESFASLLSESIDNHEAVLSVLKIVEIQIAEKGKFDLIPSGNLIQVLLEMLNSNSLDSEQKRMAMATALNNAFKKNAKLEVLFQDLLLNCCYAD